MKPTCVLFFLDFPLSKQEDKVLNADWNHENAMVCHLPVSIVLWIWGSKQGDQWKVYLYYTNWELQIYGHNETLINAGYINSLSNICIKTVTCSVFFVKFSL